MMSTALDIINIIVPKREQEVPFDSDYAFYLNSHPLLEDDYCVDVPTENGSFHLLKNAPHSDSDSDFEMTDAPQLASPFVTSNIYYLDGKSNRADSKFREELTRIFRKPFDQKEYNELYKLASQRKPLEPCNKSARGCVILESVSKSYLDHHTDLQNEIHSVRRHPYMVLKLLRGFFFWLKNVAEEGGFRPWSDESCLKEIRRR